MILQKNQVNEIVIEVSERVTLDVPYFLFHFHNQQSHLDYYCVSENTSEDTRRYDQFSIEDKTSPDNEQGEVNLPAGQYLIKVYEQETADNLDPDNTESLLYENIWSVEGDEEEITAYNGASNTGAAYGG